MKSENSASSINLYTISWSVVIFLVLLVHGGGKLFFRPTDDPKEFILYSFLFVLTGIELFKAVFGKSVTHEQKSGLSALEILFGLNVLYAIVNVLVTPTPYHEGMTHIGKFMLTGAGIYSLSRRRQEELLFLIKVLSVAAGVAVCWVIWNKGTKLWDDTDLMFLPVGQRTYYADFLMLSIPLGLLVFFESKKLSSKLVYGALTISFFCMLIVASRRSSFLGLLAMGIVSLYLVREKLNLFAKGNIKRMVLLLMLLLVFVAGEHWLKLQFQPTQPSLVQRLLNIDDELAAKSSSPLARLLHIRRSLQMFQDRPWLGWGYGNFKFVVSKYYDAQDIDPDGSQFSPHNPVWVIHPHNDLAYQLAEGGIVGAFLFYLLIAAVLRDFVVFMNDGTLTRNRILLTSFLCVLGGFVSFQFNASPTYVVIKFLLMMNFAILLKNSTHKYYLPNLTKKFATLYFCFCLYLGMYPLRFVVAGSCLVASKNNIVNISDDIILKLDSTSYDIVMTVANKHIEGSNHQAAAEILETAYRNYRYVPHVAAELINAYQKIGRFHEAKRVLKESKKTFPFYWEFNSFQI